ncbi:MAG: hypothetical protein ACOX6T_22295 [Myxococcales bacterium]|jgi:hypothetical protein
MVLQCRWNVDEVIAKSAQQAELFGSYGTQIEARTGPEVLNTVTAGSVKLRDAHRKSLDSRGDKGATTQSQTTRLKAAAKFLVARRKAIMKRYAADPGIKKAFGIGDEFNSTSLSSVNAAFERFITAAEANPEHARAAMVTEEDIAQMRQHLQDINKNEDEQEGMKISSKLTTAERNTIQFEVEEAMIKVVTAATLVFEDQPDVVALFKATLPASKRSNKKATSETDPK